MMRVGIATRIVLAAFVLAALAACGGKPDYNLTDVSGKMPDLKLFGAPDGNGKVRSASDYNGKLVALYFGYTHCPDVCPLTLSKLHRALEKLDEKAEQVQVIFCTVDPERDTEKTIRQYVHAFDPRFSAIRPTGDALTTITDRYHASYSYGPSGASGSYTVNHSSGVYVFDGTGRLRLIGSSADSVDDIAADLRTLLAYSGD